jgi:hypothetical protein
MGWFKKMDEDLCWQFFSGFSSRQNLPCRFEKNSLTPEMKSERIFFLKMAGRGPTHQFSSY